ncbi:MAG: SGNH/GDSL hydrolase family protein [Alphaproteobacteria bacterium]|nr:SGNH/GDSL hydrolase family protein [Alphaproteobacteria bacterium]
MHGIRHLALIVGGLFIGLGLAEASLRVGYHDLPSLDALADDSLQWRPAEPGVGECGDRRLQRAALIRTNRIPNPDVTLWVAGDSVTHGSGVQTRNTWWARLADALDGVGTVGIYDLSVPGAGTCSIRLQVLEGLEQAPRPDLVLVGVFADDLLAHAVLSVRGRQVLLPSAAPRWLQGPVTHSYLVNLVWFTLDRRRVSALARGMSSNGEALFRRTVTDVEEWGRTQQVPIAWVLIAPAGLERCPAVSPPAHGCSWLREDQALMASILAEAGADVIDLRPPAAGPFEPLPYDLELVEQGRSDVALHMSAAGNAELAAALAPQVRERVTAARAAAQ